MPLKSELVDCYVHERVADEPVDTQGLPLDKSFFANVVPVAIEHEVGGTNNVLRSPGQHHGRSYEVLSNAPAQWQDRYDNSFTTLISKGNNFSRPDVMRSLTAPSGFIPYGLQEGDAILRVLRASRLMREAKVDTEWIVRVVEPKVLYFEGEPLDPAEYKKHLMFKLMGNAALAGDADDKGDNPKFNDEELGTIATELNRMDFFITLRALAINERVLDVLAGWKALDLMVLEKVFNTYNRLSDARADEIKGLGLPEKLWLGSKPLSEFTDLEEVFHPKEVEVRNNNIEAYFSVVLPALIGMNMAKMHNAGLVHRFPTLTNLTSLGGIVDLDSVRGTPLGLGDEPITNRDKAEDINYMFEDEQDAELLLLVTAVMKHIQAFNPKAINQNYYANRFKNNLLRAYLVCREWDSGAEGTKDILDFLYELAQLEKWDNYSMHYTAQLTRGYVGDSCKEMLAEHLAQNAINLPAADAVDAIYKLFIKDPAENGQIIEPPDKQDQASEEEVRNAIQKWLLNEDPAKGRVIIADWHRQIYTYMHSLVLESMRNDMNSFIGIVKERLSDTSLKDIDDELVDFIFYSNIHRPIHDYVLSVEFPSDEEIVELIVKRFLEDYSEISKNYWNKKEAKG